MRKEATHTLGLRRLGRIEIPGGGQVVVENSYAYVGHMAPPHGTSILDVSDPTAPRLVAELDMPAGMHSHKVRVHDDIMIVNYEHLGDAPDQPVGGLKIFDISNKGQPREIAFFACAGKGVHRFDFDGRYVYLSPEVEGCVGNVVMIVDLADPARPREVSRWWLPGQAVAAGEKPDWEGRAHRNHHPLRYGDRLYVSYWHGGFVILDISDLEQPRLVSHLDWSPPYPSPTHTVLRIPWQIQGGDWLFVADEEVIPERLNERIPAFVWMVDVSEESRPVPVSTYMLPRPADLPPQVTFGAHQPQERLYDSRLAVTWFAGGLRILDISDPYRLTEVGYHLPEPAPGAKYPQSNDVYVTPEGRLYLLDRLGGLEILEYE